VDLAIAPKDDDPTLGELVVRGANVTSGYWQRPEPTAETIIDGWLHTGDVVRVDPAGRVHIVDQTKAIIMRGRREHFHHRGRGPLAGAPGVLEAAVLAVPDEVMGEKVGAIVYRGNEAVDVDKVLAHCQGGWPTSRCPVTSASPARRCRAMRAASWSRRACARRLSGNTASGRGCIALSRRPNKRRAQRGGSRRSTASQRVCSRAAPGSRSGALWQCLAVTRLSVD
jgi:acyl-CoA synthetase (AMP-forming)/AMP-acid ligase II